MKHWQVILSIRVLPVLKDKTESGAIKLSTIINTHQYITLHHFRDLIQESLTKLTTAITTMPAETKKLYTLRSILLPSLLTLLAKTLPASHIRRQKLWQRHQYTRTQIYLLHWRSHKSYCTTHTMPYARQYLLFLWRWNRQSSLHRRHPVYRRSAEVPIRGRGKYKVTQFKIYWSLLSHRLRALLRR